MIAYNKIDAQAAFAGLADILEKVAAHEIVGNQPIADVLDELRRIVEADPTANPIRKAFEKAWDIAARAGDAEAERELHKRHVDLIAAYNAVPNADDQADAGETYQRHLRSHAAWVRAVNASIDDKGRRTDTQAADGEKIARKVVEVIGDKLKDIATDANGAKVAAEAAAVGVDELAAEMTAWREWVRELAKHPNVKPGEPKLCAVVQGKICEIWQRFKNAPADCELPSGEFRKTKRTFAECLALHGHDEVWRGKRLIDFTPDETAFERVVHNGAEKARQAKAKTRAKPQKSQKRKTQARRKK